MSSKKSEQSLSAARVLPPPSSGAGTKRALNSYGAARDENGRISRKTGRNKQFATIVTPEFHAWIKGEAKDRGKRMCVLLEDMRAAYLKVRAGSTR